MTKPTESHFGVTIISSGDLSEVAEVATKFCSSEVKRTILSDGRNCLKFSQTAEQILPFRTQHVPNSV